MWWTMAAAQRWFDERQDVRELGWALALTGSVLLYGEGRDLDVIAVPIASNAADLCALWDADGWKVVGDPLDKPSGVRMRIYEDDVGRLVDVMFLPRRQEHRP